MSAKVTADEISTIVKERIDNFEYNPDIVYTPKKYNYNRGETPEVIVVDEFGFTNDDKSKMYVVNDYKDGLVYVNHHIDFPIGSIVEFRDARGNTGVFTGYEGDRSVITVLSNHDEMNIGKPLWVTDKILPTPNTTTRTYEE